MRNGTQHCALIVACFALACSDDGGSADPSGAGGSALNTGGTVETGSGGNSLGGNYDAAGGQPGTGGQSALGGQPGSGGTPTTGGSSAMGGAPSLGGAPGLGGSSPSGGAPSLGGAPGTGGVSTGGGQGETGGTSGSSGGGESTGGAAGAAGGTQSSGGSTSTGGVDNLGGAAGDDGPGGAAGAGTGGQTVSCPSTVLSPGDTNETVMVGSQSRSYVLHVPAAYDGSSAVPLVVDFHPLGGSGPSERSSSPYPAQTDPEGVIMAFPSGQSGPMGGAWNVGPCCVANVDDVAFARALVEQVQGKACIDPKRIYAVGFSMGGGMSHYLACHAADVFAAVAPAAFDLLEENVGSCAPSRPITVVSFRGTSDPVVSYAGGYSDVVSGMPITFLGAPGTFEAWAGINECTGSPSAEDAQGCSTYSNCQDGVQVTLCTKQGGGHEAGNASVGWPILKQYTMP